MFYPNGINLRVLHHESIWALTILQVIISKYTIDEEKSYK